MRHVFIEVHFFLLAAQHRDEVPREIETLVTSCGYRVGWVDLSPIHAQRLSDEARSGASTWRRPAS